jgi:hypothetical protein
MSRRLPDKCWGDWNRTRAIAPARCGLRTVAPPPPVPRTARIAPTCTVLPPSAREVGRSPYFCNGFWPAPSLLCSTRPLCLTSPTNAPASVTRMRLRLSDRANVHRAAAPIGGAACCRPAFVTATASDTPYAQPGLCASRVPPTRPRRRSASLHAPAPRVTHRSANAVVNAVVNAVGALPDSPPVPRSDAKHSFLPRNCSAAWPGSDARQPEPLASHALLHGVRSCTSSPELPPVAYQLPLPD